MQQRDDERANERERERERDRKQQQRDVLFDPSMLSFVMPASQDIVLAPSSSWWWCNIYGALVGTHLDGEREREREIVAREMCVFVRVDAQSFETSS